MTSGIRIRVASPDDAAALLAIYAPYVEETAITFEYRTPSAEEFRGRIREVQKKYPYLTAERDGRPVGYAYVSPFKERAAYNWAVETSVYVDRAEKRGGVGRRLYAALEACLRAQGILNVNACIAYPAAEDPYLTRDSVAFHEACGYRMAGRFHECASKFGRWYDMVWMEKSLGAHPSDPPPVRPFPEIQDEVVL